MIRDKLLKHTRPEISFEIALNSRLERVCSNLVSILRLLIISPDLSFVFFFQERTEEVALERAPVTQGLLRVKKEEELQEVPGSGGGGAATTGPATDSEGTRTAGQPPLCREGNAAGATTSVVTPPFLLGSRRASPPPEDWKPLDKCYFCLDGKLPHDDQPPLVSNIFSLSFSLLLSFSQNGEFFLICRVSSRVRSRMAESISRDFVPSLCALYTFLQYSDYPPPTGGDAEETNERKRTRGSEREPVHTASLFGERRIRMRKSRPFSRARFDNMIRFWIRRLADIARYCAGSDRRSRPLLALAYLCYLLLTQSQSSRGISCVSPATRFFARLPVVSTTVARRAAPAVFSLAFSIIRSSVTSLRFAACRPCEEDEEEKKLPLTVSFDRFDRAYKRFTRLARWL